MKKLYNFRLDPDLITDMDRLGRSRTSIVTDALQMYLHEETQTNYNVNLVSLLKSEIVDLRKDKEYLMNQNNALMVMKTPLLQQIIYKLRSHDG